MLPRSRELVPISRRQGIAAVVVAQQRPASKYTAESS
jgi:hypothetical protein